MPRRSKALALVVVATLLSCGTEPEPMSHRYPIDGPPPSPPGWFAAYYDAQNALDIFNTQSYALPPAGVDVDSPITDLPPAKYIIDGVSAMGQDYSGPGTLRVWVGSLDQNRGGEFGGQFPPIIRVESSVRNATNKWQNAGVRQWMTSRIVTPVIFPIRLAVFANPQFDVGDASLYGEINCAWEAVSSGQGISGSVPIETQTRKFNSGIGPGVAYPDVPGGAKPAQPIGGYTQNDVGLFVTQDGYQGWEPNRARLLKGDVNDDFSVVVFHGQPGAPSVTYDWPSGTADIEVPLSEFRNGLYLINNGIGASNGQVTVIWYADRT